MSNNRSKKKQNNQQLMESCEFTCTRVKKKSKNSKQKDNSEESGANISSRVNMSHNRSKEEHNNQQLMESCEFTCTRMKKKSKNSKQKDNSEESGANISSRVNMSDNRSKEEHNNQQLMESCEFTCTRMKKKSKNSKQKDNSEESGATISSRTETESNAESEEFDYHHSLELKEVTSEKNGAKIIFATDDFYGVAENLLKNDDPVCNEHMMFSNKTNNNVDGWKTQKMRNERHNFVIIQLPGATVIQSICINTACFINEFSEFSVQGKMLSECLIGIKYKPNRTNKLGTSCNMKDYISMHDNTKDWNYLILPSTLSSGYPSMCKKSFCVLPHYNVTHLRLNIFPDGGIARFRAYGKVIPAVTPINRDIDLISSLYNSHCTLFSDSSIGHPNNIILPNEATSIVEGWNTVEKHYKYYKFNETSFDEISVESWAIFRLGCRGTVTHVVIDTRLFTGNAPYMVRVQGCFGKTDDNLNDKWEKLISDVHINPGTELSITVDKDQNSIVNWVKITIKPDGGISRFRVFGKPKILRQKI
ncbi:probable inactive allantoicase isoform X1 [Linepithema humile]|uniref:probable inactive allantoicase isoform X1 n=3 Tax=Linepithema humile TaxID=83485 RepID=UPI00351F7D61